MIYKKYINIKDAALSSHTMDQTTPGIRIYQLHLLPGSQICTILTDDQQPVWYRIPQSEQGSSLLVELQTLVNCTIYYSLEAGLEEMIAQFNADQQSQVL